MSFSTWTEPLQLWTAGQVVQLDAVEQEVVETPLLERKAAKSNALTHPHPSNEKLGHKPIEKASSHAHSRRHSKSWLPTTAPWKDSKSSR